MISWTLLFSQSFKVAVHTNKVSIGHPFFQCWHAACSIFACFRPRIQKQVLKEAMVANRNKPMVWSQCWRPESSDFTESCYTSDIYSKSIKKLLHLPSFWNSPQFADLWQVVRDDFEKSATSTEESEDKAADEFTKLKLQSKTDISGKTTQKKLNEEIQDGGGKEDLVFFLFLWFLKKIPSKKPRHQMPFE